MNGNATQMRAQEAAVAVSMVMDENRGLVMAGELGMSADNARILRDQLARQLNAALHDRIAIQDQQIADQTEELATLARIAEEYRTGEHYLSRARGGVLPRIARLGSAVRTVRPQARAWAVRHLPYPVLSALRSIKARTVKS